MIIRARLTLSIFSFFTLIGCQTAPTTQSGYLTSYEGEMPKNKNQRAAISKRIDIQASDAIDSVYIQPTIIASGVGSGFSEAELQALRQEVDRQICYEISERFIISPILDENSAIIRTSIVRLQSTGSVGSGASAIGKFFNPIPMVEVRVPGSLGGLAIESELLAPNSLNQIAFITWSRNATIIGTESPSLSPIGDALQLAEPMGDAMAEAFSSSSRKARKVGSPDPCQHYGPRFRITGGAVIGAVTGLYVPEDGNGLPPKAE